MKRPAVWSELVRCVGIRINEQKVQLTTKIDFKQDANGQAFSIRKTEFPCVKVQCRFLAKKRIEIFFSYRRSDNAEILNWEEHVDFHVDELDRVQFKNRDGKLIDVKDVCLLVLLPIRDAKFEPPERAAANVRDASIE